MKKFKPVRIKPLFVFICIILIFPSSNLPAYIPNPEEAILLSKIEKDSLQYFLRYSDKKTGLTRDSSQPGSPASIAATGFALAAVAIGESRGWIPKEQAYKQIDKTLDTLIHQAEHQNGFFYHFLDPQTGKRVWDSEASSIDTALLIAGALIAAQYFPDTSFPKKVQIIYERVQWQWMMNGSSFLCMGWKPETGFLPYYWDSYSELILLQALAIGASKQAIPEEAWLKWMRHENEYAGHRIIHSGSGSLFTYQYAQAFIDFRDLNDQGINYFENSKKATLANLNYSLEYRNQYKSYSEFSWGLSASVGPGGYKAYGAKPGEGLHDGTIAPYAAIASIVFTPEASIQAVRYFYENYQKNLYGKMGFKGAFNVDKNWWSQEYLGIDQGITVLMLENFLNDGAIWKKFMGLSEIERWIDLCNLKTGETTLSS